MASDRERLHDEALHGTRPERRAMTGRYEQWIAEHIPGEAYGLCAEATKAMALVFPELRRVRGHYYCPHWGRRAHWWLVAPDGSIIDPTARQFPSQGRGVYDPWDETQPEPTGTCPNCGEYCYDHKLLCSRACEISYAAYCAG